MLGFAIGALVISLIAGALGLTGIAHAAAAVAKIVFGVFLAIAVILFVMVALGISLFT